MTESLVANMFIIIIKIIHVTITAIIIIIINNNNNIIIIIIIILNELYSFSTMSTNLGILNFM